MGWGMRQADPGRWTLAATGSGGDGEGGGPWWRRGAAATGRAEDLVGGDGERQRRGGQRTLVVMGIGGDRGAGGPLRRRGAGREGEREGGRDSVTLPKGLWTIRTCKGVSGLPPRARGGGVLGEERGWGPWGSNELWRRGESSEEGVVVHLYLACTSHFGEMAANLSCLEGDCTRTCVCNECGRALARARRHVRARAPTDAGADRINGRALLAASRLDSREAERSTHLEQSWR